MLHYYIIGSVELGLFSLVITNELSFSFGGGGVVVVVVVVVRIHTLIKMYKNTKESMG